MWPFTRRQMPIRDEALVALLKNVTSLNHRVLALEEALVKRWPPSVDERLHNLDRDLNAALKGFDPNGARPEQNRTRQGRGTP